MAEEGESKYHSILSRAAGYGLAIVAILGFLVIIEYFLPQNIVNVTMPVLTDLALTMLTVASPLFSVLLLISLKEPSATNRYWGFRLLIVSASIVLFFIAPIMIVAYVAPAIVKAPVLISLSVIGLSAAALMFISLGILMTHAIKEYRQQVKGSSTV